MNRGDTVVEPWFTMVVPWYNGRFRHGTPILVNLVKSPEVGEWLGKSGSMINNHLFTGTLYERSLNLGRNPFVKSGFGFNNETGFGSLLQKDWTVCLLVVINI